MERIRRVFERENSAASYEALDGGSEGADGEHMEVGDQAFSWTDYAVFTLLGVAMLWAWNMFLAAAPYFQRRFATNGNLLRNFQSGILSVGTIGNLGSMIILTKLQARANYPKRITVALALNVAVFTLLAISTKMFLNVAAGVYFAFLMLMVLSASLATGLCQNGVFAYVSGFGREEYTQGIMAGQGIAGVLPAITQIVSVLSVPKRQQHAGGDAPQESSTSAFIYFLTATGVSAATLVAFFYLLTRPSSKQRMARLSHDDEGPDYDSTHPDRKTVPLTRLLKKLFWLAGAVFLTFAVTMFFPVFTPQILSTHDPVTAPRLFQPAAFIPLGFFFWNLGDLLGRVGPALPALRLTHRPRLLFALSVARVLFIPMYFLCNIGAKGAAVNSDFFYLVIVQLGFGVTNGFLSSNCMMGFAEWVEPDELEAAGGFMSLSLVSGLTVGSFLSFFAAQSS
ncbi:nucleoside transporter family [Pyrenophora seminiperda CCB06]|uniref:Nucleoside transporter family n=1 Tax=Pyrenophora seminiperda CCB06 TaxID=1302712 RepID=A0A3M7LXS9_9PLEO|nr:nucleoside transporter family [Pyrenophora seminiperda CCB06]